MKIQMVIPLSRLTARDVLILILVVILKMRQLIKAEINSANAKKIMCIILISVLKAQCHL